MAYNAAIPLSTDKLSSSQVDLYNNFQAINTFVAVDHVGFNAATSGKHNRVFFVQQSGDVATAGATDAVLYTKAGTGGANSLYYRGASNATPIEISYALKAASGYTRLPSGIIMQWASGTITAGVASITVTLPIAFPGDVLNCQVSPTTGPGSSHSSDFIIYAIKSTTQNITVGRGTTHTTVQVPFNLLVIGY